MANSVYIDAGGHTGQTILAMAKRADALQNFKIYSFEPHPRCFSVIEKYQSENVIVSNKAIWTEDGELEFYLDMLDATSERHTPGQGSTIFKTKTEIGIPGQFNDESLVRVPCIDFSKWVFENVGTDDQVFLKMDIEGAEYQVLDKMMKDGSIEYIDEIEIEFHWHKIGLEKTEHDELVDRLRRACRKIEIRTE